jgi:hypothetical protein
MQTDLTLDEMLKNVFSLLADDTAAKPRRSAKPVADPALWRALENQEKNGSDRHSGIGSQIPIQTFGSSHS